MDCSTPPQAFLHCKSSLKLISLIPMIRCYTRDLKAVCTQVHSLFDLSLIQLIRFLQRARGWQNGSFWVTSFIFGASGKPIDFKTTKTYSRRRQPVIWCGCIILPAQNMKARNLGHHTGGEFNGPRSTAATLRLRLFGGCVGTWHPLVMTVHK